MVFLPAVAAFGHEENLPSGGAEDRQARSLHVLLYHPYPDPQGDPWGVPGGTKEGAEVGYMEAAYGAYWYPTAVFDGLEAPGMKIEGATTFLESFNAYEAAYKERREVDAPLRLALGGWVVDGRAALEVDVEAKRAIQTDNLTLRIVAFEDEVPYDGGNNVDVHRFTVRAIVHDARMELAANLTATQQAMVPLDPEWNLDRLGFVASVHNRDPNSPEFKPGEVLQAATYRFAQTGPTIQYSRGVLLEMLTATWCAACLYGDNAVDELANAYGYPSSKFLDREWAYLRFTHWDTILWAAAAGAAGLAVVWWIHTTRRHNP